ncbi:MAG: MBL fold metallo-hydrolase [Bacteroidota bacterium]
MKLTILGVNSPFPRDGRATLGYLVRQDETRLLLEAGCGIYRRLAEEGLLDSLDGIVLSHLHYDHCADLPAIVLGTTMGSRRSDPLPVFVPPGQGDRLRSWLDACGFSFVGDRMALAEPAWDMPTVLGRLRFTASPAKHGLPAAILTLEADGHRLVYTGDTADCDALRRAMTRADLVLSEVTGLSPQESSEKGHLPPVLLGELARAAGIKELVLTHFMHGYEAETLAAEVTAAFGRPARVARVGEVFRV